MDEFEKLERLEWRKHIFQIRLIENLRDSDLKDKIISEVKNICVVCGGKSNKFRQLGIDLSFVCSSECLNIYGGLNNAK